MKLIHLLFQNSGKTLTLAVMAGLLSGASSAGLIALINFSLAHLASPNWVLAASFIGLCGLLMITAALSQIWIAQIAQKIVFNLQMQLTKKILETSLQHLETIGQPRLLAILTEDVDTLSRMAPWIAAICVNVALLGGCLIYLCWLSMPLFLGLGLFIFLGAYSHRKILVDQGAQGLMLARETRDRLFQHFRAVTDGVKELKLHRQRQRAFLNEDLQSAAADFQHHRVRGMTVYAVAGSWSMVSFFAPIGVLIYGLPQFGAIPAPLLSSYVLTIVFMVNPLRAVLNSLPQLRQANIALDKIDSIGVSLGQLTESQGAFDSPLAPPWKSLQLVGVTHKYLGQGDSLFSLGPLDLTLYPGELVFLIGGNGSGKSTLVKLLSGLYAPEAGSIQVDGIAITDANRADYRQLFSVIFSDFYLFDRLLGLEARQRESQIQDYLVQLQLQHKVQIQGDKLSTTALSQGQRKRLALLSAYLEDRPIYIFDEWASDQDPAFKDVFYSQLLPELKQRGKTVVVVSHDDRYFDRADRAVKLDFGKVVYDKRLQN